MGGASSFYAMLAICGFLSATWGASKLSRLAGVSSIVLEITTGVVLGPRVLGLINKEYTVCEHTRHVECEGPPDLVKRIALNQPLGEHLGKIANMDYCDKDAYMSRDHHGGGHGGIHNGGYEDDDRDDSGSHIDGVDGGLQGNVSEDDQGNTSWADENGTDEGAEHLMQLSWSESGAGHAGPDSGSSSHGEHHSGIASGADAPNSQSMGHAGIAAPQDADGGHHEGDVRRRLSGGGGGLQYPSYEECLVGSCEQEVSHQCGLTPDVFTLIGHAGVALMIFESGMHFDFEKARVVGLPACAVAVLGTILPLISGTALVAAYGKPIFPDGISAGTALAPTSVGIALRLLGEAGVLQENFGQAIITAAFVDDILSLVLFNVLFSLGGDFDVVKTVVFPIVGIVFMLIAMVGAVKAWPIIIDRIIMPRLPDKRNPSLRGFYRFHLTQDEALFVIQITLLCFYAFITHLLGTHLWGCFIAGMSFACLRPPHHAHHVWVKQTKRLTTWMIRIFFACTVAFSIPVGMLLSFDAFWKGSLLGIGPCVLTKVLCAPFMGPARFVIGWAMVGRAEFAYLIAQMALASGMLDQETFSIVIWALLWATILAPFVFRFLLNRYVRAQGLGEGVTKPLAQIEEEEHQGLEIFEGRGEAHSYNGGKQSRPEFASNNADDRAYAERMQDLEDIDVAGGVLQASAYGKPCGDADCESDKQAPWAPPAPQELPALGGAAEPQRLLGSRQAHDSDAMGKGFLCCLFFKKVVVQ